MADSGTLPRIKISLVKCVGSLMHIWRSERVCTLQTDGASTAGIALRVPTRWRRPTTHMHKRSPKKIGNPFLVDLATWTS